MSMRVALTVGSRFALTALSLVSSIVTARVLGEAGRGDYFFITTLSATLVQFTNFGLPVSGAYDVARDPASAPSVVANAFWISIVGAGGSGVVLAIAVEAFGALQSTPMSFLLLAAALAAPSLFFTIVANVLTGQERFIQFNLLEAGSRALAVLGIVAAGLIGAGAAGFVGAAVATWAASAAATGWAALRGHRIRLTFDRRIFTTGFRYATKAYLITLMGFLVLRANVFLLRREYGPDELGLYSIAAQFGDVLSIVPQAVALVLFPRLVRESGSRWSSTVRATLNTAALLVVTCGAAAALAKPIIRLLYGNTFTPAATVLQIMLPGIVCLGVANVLSQYLGAEGIPRALVGVWGAAVVVLATLSLLLVPHHAGAGAAAALSATYAAVFVAIFVIALRQRRRPARADALPPVHIDVEDVPPAAE
jgi:O-antigen/teichoic acid export membrane protein